MKVQRLIEKYKKLEGVWDAEGAELARQIFLQDLEQLDEPETGHADEAPRYVKNILARLRELPLHDREVWLKAIMGEFEQDFSHAKWREGYEQGKFEGEWAGQQLKDADKIRQELNKPVIPQFVADWIEVCKEHLTTSLYTAMSPNFMKENNQSFDFILWIKKTSNQDLFARAWLDGYEVEKEKEKEYKVVLLNYNDGHLNLVNVRTLGENIVFFTKKTQFDPRSLKLTKAEIISSGFGWVFDCEGIEIEEVEE